jgi:plastocyanin
MVPSLILTLLASPPAAAGPCEISGKVEFLRAGKPANPKDRVFVFVDRTEVMLKPREPVTHTIRQINREFVPSVLVVQREDQVQFSNEDRIPHGVFSQTRNNSFDAPANPKSITKTQTFKGLGPTRIQCAIHDRMRADVLVVPNAWYAGTESDGAFRLPSLPIGSYLLTAWEPNGAKRSIQVVDCKAPTQVQFQLPEDPEPKLAPKPGVPPPIPGGGY